MFERIRSQFQRLQTFTPAFKCFQEYDRNSYVYKNSTRIPIVRRIRSEFQSL